MDGGGSHKALPLVEEPQWLLREGETIFSKSVFPDKFDMLAPDAVFTSMNI